MAHQLEAVPLHLPEIQNNFSAVSPSRHERKGPLVSSICPEISPALGLQFKLYHQHGWDPNEIGAPATTTLEFIRNRTVPVVSCGANKQSFTVVLGVTVNGEELPMKVMFDDVRQLNINTHQGCKSQFTRKAGWMNKVCSLFIFKNDPPCSHKGHTSPKFSWCIKLLSTCRVCKFVFVYSVSLLHVTIFIIHILSNKAVDLTEFSVYPRPKSSNSVGFFPWAFDRWCERSFDAAKCQCHSYSWWILACVAATQQIHEQAI